MEKKIEHDVETGIILGVEHLQKLRVGGTSGIASPI